MRHLVGASLAVVTLLMISTASAQTASDKIGQVSFPISCNPAVQKPFERGVALLHSFWYLESVKVFTAVTQADPDCAMGYWGVAMSLWYQIWSPPSPANLKRGWEAVEKAKAAPTKTQRERDWVAAAEAFYKDGDKLDHKTRALAYEKAMAQVYARYPQDREAMAFYALALQATAEPHDKTYAKQKKSAELAENGHGRRAGSSRRRTLHHPRLRLPDAGPRAASTPRAATTSSRRRCRMRCTCPRTSTCCSACGRRRSRAISPRRRPRRPAAIPDDHMHALDYLVYAYLQQGQDVEARKVLAEGRAIMADLAARKVESGRPTGHFAIAAMEARWAMERGQWQEAASIEPRPNRFAHTESMIYFARAIGAARTGNAAQARIDADKIAALRDALQQAKNTYWAEQVEIQRRAAAAWVARAEGKNDEALRLMRSAAELEEATEKHNITPGPIATARELCGDLLMDLGQPAQAVREYEASLKLAPARFKALHGAGRAAELAGDRETAKSYYVRLVAVAAPADTQRPELAQAKSFLGSK